jgi:hypothetical protein
VYCNCSVDRRGLISTFEFSIDEVVRDAWPLVRQANRFNPPPDEAHAYLALKVTMRYLSGPTDDAFQVNPIDFKIVASDRSLINQASIIGPEPMLEGSIFPGATAAGYLIYEVRKDAGDLELLWETNFNGERGVWFAIR